MDDDDVLYWAKNQQQHLQPSCTIVCIISTALTSMHSTWISGEGLAIELCQLPFAAGMVGRPSPAALQVMRIDHPCTYMAIFALSGSNHAGAIVGSGP